MESNETVKWRIYPLLEDPKRTALFVILVLVTIAVVDIAFGERWLTALATLFLLGSLRMFWTPTWFEVTSEGIVVKTPFYRVTHRWERFKIVKNDPRGLVLTPFRSDSRLESFRGLFLRLPPNDPELKTLVKTECEKYLTT
ncbi:MAG: hypothetical protein OEM52_08875 [bacterium]|nr:hypothetical protein [bacterium]